MYDYVKLPIAQEIAAFLTGGVEGCTGSADYDLCLSQFLSNTQGDNRILEIENSEVFSFSEEVRALAAAAAGFAGRELSEAVGLDIPLIN